MEEKKDKEKLAVPPPQVPCDECINNRGKRFENDVAVCYCKHNNSVGIFHIKKMMWEILHPVSKEQYERSIARAINRAEGIGNPNAWWN